MGDNSPEKKSGCGLLNAVFGRRWPRRTNSSSSLPGIKDSNNNFVKITQNTPTPKRRRNSSDDNTFLEAEAEAGVSEAPPKQLVSKSAPNNQPIKPPPPVNVYQQQHIVKKPPQAASVQEALPQKQQQQQHQLNSYNSQGYVNQGWRVPREATGISGELESMIADHQKSKGSNNLVRASSSNVMLFGNLGNLRQGGGNTGSTANTNTYEQFFETSLSSKQPNKYPNSVMGNVVKKQNDDSNHDRAVPAQDASLCRALSTRMDPETLKMMGNEDYKSGNFAEALALYDAAISIDPNKASYRSNKSAALTALGRLLEAVFECREAIRIEPRYHRAHHRLATLYLRLGEVEKAIYHYKHAGPEADQIDIAKCKTVQGHLNKCTDVKRMRDWNSLIKETEAAISAGADSAPSIYALQAEALLKVHRHQEADEAMKNGSKFSVDDCTKFFGPIGNANLLVVQAQVNLAVGRFDDALAVVQKAAKLDSNNKEVNPVMRRARAVAAARSNGNELFKASRFSEASVAYGEGLEHDPYNSVLLCNRAACRSKLGQYEKAVEDCNSALNVRPKYMKARLRRADCYAKLEKWEASIKDYEILLRESPEDEEVIKALKKLRHSSRKNMVDLDCSSLDTSDKVQYIPQKNKNKNKNRAASFSSFGWKKKKSFDFEFEKGKGVDCTNWYMNV